jgi:hypothetical protein
MRNKKDKNEKFLHYNFSKKNRRGDIPITILVVGTIAVCIYALFSFSFTSIKIRNSFAGLGSMEELSSQIEENSFYGTSNSVELTRSISSANSKAIVERTCNCGSNCEKYVNWIIDSCNQEGIDPILFLSLMMQESSCKSNVASDSSIGLMQINLDNCGKYGLSNDKEECRLKLIDNPETNILVGAKILKEKYNELSKGKLFEGCTKRKVFYEGWEAALRGYNGWGCDSKYPKQDYFVDDVMKRYKILKGNYLEREENKGGFFSFKKETVFSVEYTQL